jgi:hypothetical protein
MFRVKRHNSGATTVGARIRPTTNSVSGTRYTTPHYLDGIVGDQTWLEPAGAAGATLLSLSGLSSV